MLWAPAPDYDDEEDYGHIDMYEDDGHSVAESSVYPEEVCLCLHTGPNLCCTQLEHYSVLGQISHLQPKATTSPEVLSPGAHSPVDCTEISTIPQGRTTETACAVISTEGAQVGYHKWLKVRPLTHPLPILGRLEL